MGWVMYTMKMVSTIQCYIILGSCCGNPGQNIHYKNRGAEAKGRGFLIGLAGQQVVISSP